MPGFPVVCERCGAPFVHPGFQVGGRGLTIESADARIGPHPGCGGYGVIPAGTYEWVAGGVKATLRDTRVSPADVERIVELLDRLHGVSSVEEADAVLEDAPEWAKEILDRFDKGESVGRRIFLLQLLLSIVAWLVPSPLASRPEVTPITVPTPSSVQGLTDKDLDELAGRVADELADRMTERAGQATTPSSPPGASPQSPVRKSPEERIGRNDPCHCGSGRKFKYCHGR